MGSTSLFQHIIVFLSTFAPSTSLEWVVVISGDPGLIVKSFEPLTKFKVILIFCSNQLVDIHVSLYTVFVEGYLKKLVVANKLEIRPSRREGNKWMRLLFNTNISRQRPDIFFTHFASQLTRDMGMLFG